jgi:hypothetical protein
MSERSEGAHVCADFERRDDPQRVDVYAIGSRVLKEER